MFVGSPYNFAGGGGPPELITDGLVSRWKLNSNLLDSVGGNNGSAVGSVTYEAAKLGDGVKLVSGNAVNNMGASSAFNFIHQTSVFTINFWIKNTSNSGMIIGNTDYNVTKKGFNLYQTNDEGTHTVVFQIGQNGTPSVDYVILQTNNVSDPFSVYTMVTIIGNNTDIKMFYNGVQVAAHAKPSATITGNAQGSLGLGLFEGSVGPLDCTVDDMCIWNTDKSLFISDLYNGGAGFDF